LCGVGTMKLKTSHWEFKSRCEENGHLFKEARYILGKKIPHSLYCVVCGAAAQVKDDL